MRLLRQLEFVLVGQALRLPRVVADSLCEAPRVPQGRGYRRRDVELENVARKLLRVHGANRIANDVRIEWTSRLKTAAGRADYRQKLISLNPRLHEYPAEIDRTLRHELAHFLAQFRVGRRRILPHGPEWREACSDLGIGDEKRCHNLPFPVGERARRYLYQCPNCQRDFPRMRRIRRAVACLACCRVHSRGEFDARFRLKLVRRHLEARHQLDAPLAPDFVNEASDLRQ